MTWVGCGADRHRVTSYDQLPADLPVPRDDGAADHLSGTRAPAVPLAASTGESVCLDQVPGRTVLFIYPMTGAPGQRLPTEWDAIPGARGCTPQACAIRDSHAEFAAHEATVFGLSTQSPTEQVEAAGRLHLPYPLLSDSDLELTRTWQLPTFSVDGLVLLRRLTIFLSDGVVDGLIYPVFPPDRSAQAALTWLREGPGRTDAAEPRPGIGPGRGLPHPIPPRLVR